ncbi:hypothetical protein D3C71_2089840 [compost metagenome]
MHHGRPVVSGHTVDSAGVQIDSVLHRGVIAAVLADLDNRVTASYAARNAD